MKSKVISFIIGGIIGFVLWHIQVTAWAATPVGYTEIQEYAVDDPEEYMETNYVDIPEDVREICESYGEEYGICAEVLEALAWRESRCTDAQNGNCKGIAQINGVIHKDRMKKLGVSDLHDFEQNIHVATDYLMELYESNGDLAQSLDEYNGNGKGGKSKYAKQILTVASCLDRTGGD